MTAQHFRPAALIPVYNHHQVINELLDALEKAGLPVILVDDGSGTVCAQALDQAAQTHPGASLVRLAKNGGKGAAVIAGLYVADNMGFTHVLQIDADGQHDLGKVGAFLKDAASHPESLICGYPVYDETVPKARLAGRKLTNFWVRINTGGSKLTDAMCGFRVYPIAQTLPVLPSVKTRRMDFDPDIAVRLVWAGVEVINRPVHVTYPRDGISHFRGFSDNVRISRMHAVHFCTMLLRRLGLRSRS